MDIARDGSGDKRLILNELSRCLKSVFIEASTSIHSSAHLNLNSSLILCVDRTLQHGLHNLLHGYWPLVRSYSHAQTLQTIDYRVGSRGSHRNKGQAWLLATLAEGSFLSYLHCILAEPQTIHRFYAPHAILCDPSCVSQLSSLLTGLESINFSVEKSSDFNHESIACTGLEERVKPVLNLSLSGGDGLPAAMTSSMSSSLASPGDSGFTQIDSETDTASFSEVLLEADCTSMKEDIAVLPVDPCTEKTVRTLSPMEPLTMSDIANANANAHFSTWDAKSPSVECSVDWPHIVSDEVVFRRPETKTGKAPNLKQQKRVSFHECTQDMPPNDILLDNNTLSKEAENSSSLFRESASNLSRAVSDLSSFECEQEGVEIAKDSSVLGNDGIEELSLNNSFNSCLCRNSACDVEYSGHGVKFVSLRETSQNIVEKTPVAERGIPEGQEDPPYRCSVSTAASYHLPISSNEKFQMSNHSSPAPSCSSLRPQVSTPRRLPNGSNTLAAASTPYSTSVFSQTPSKACLVNRFLRSITEKKISNRRSEAAQAALNKRKLSAKKLNLYINGVKPMKELSDELLSELMKEMDGFSHEPLCTLSQTNHISVELTSTLNEFLHYHLALSECEKVLKVLKIRHTSADPRGRRMPLLAVLTDNALYAVNQTLQKHSVTLYSDLTSVLVGPNSQWISLICAEKSFEVNFLIDGNDVVSELISSVEIALRRKGRISSQLPVIIDLSYDEFFAIPQWLPVLKAEKVYHYSVVHAVEEAPNLPNSSLGPDMKAYFMFRTCGNDSMSLWQPGFFVLLASTLYVSSDEEASPQHRINLLGVQCRPISLKSRPHTIEVGSVHIAAPDDFVAYAWLVALQKASSRVLEPAATDFKPSILSGSLIVTESRLMLISSLGIPKEDLDKTPKPLLTAFVSDVTSVKIGDAESCWCIVEFSCREVHESSGDYVIFFSTFYEMLSFRDSLKKLSPILKQGNCSLVEKETLRLRCSEISAALSHNWSFDTPKK